MDVNQLRLKRVLISNFKSLKRVELDNLNNLALFMGRNNAGKSNILDSFKFLSDAATSFDHALASRGRKLSEILFRKQEQGRMEFVFDFVLAPDKRAQMARTLFASNQLTSPEKAVGSNFLSLVTLKISITAEQFSEELSVSNLRKESHPVVVFSLKGSQQGTQASCGFLESLCTRCGDELPTDSPALDLPQASSEPFRLRLGRPDGAEKYPISNELAALVYQQFSGLEWVDPLRRLPSSSPIQGELTIEPDASNLPDVLHWLYNNKPRQFRQIESEVAKLVPQLGKLYTPTQQNSATLGLIDSQDEDLVYTMDQMSFGTRSLVAIVAKVILTKPGAWVCVEEPETYLHPQAQLGLFDFLRDQATQKRIFVATHSTFVAASCPIESLFVVHRDNRSCTVATPVTEKTVIDVIEQLGVKPSFSFEADAIVFVEGAEAAPVLNVWAKKFGFRIQVQFIDIEGGSTLHYYANTRVALSKFVHTLVFAVFGKDIADASGSMRQRVTARLQLSAAQMAVMDYREIEGYLLDSKAILKAFPTMPASESELEESLASARAQPNPKKALRDLLVENRTGEYTGTMGAHIAEAIETIPTPILQLFQQIDADSKPYWKI